MDFFIYYNAFSIIKFNIRRTLFIFYQSKVTLDLRNFAKPMYQDTTFDITLQKKSIFLAGARTHENETKIE